MEQLALSHDHISFKYLVNGQTKLHSSGNSSLRDVIYHIYGREITKELLPVTWEKNGMSLDGFAGKPVVARGNRAFENYYVNGRYVKSKLITKAIEDAYKPFLMQHKYPFVCFQLQLPGEEVDINVHPTKMEVRFQKQQEVYQAVYEALTNTLHHRELIPSVPLKRETKEGIQEKKPAAKGTGPEPFEKNRTRALRKEPQKEIPKETGKKPPEKGVAPSSMKEDKPVWKVSGEKPAETPKLPETVSKKEPEAPSKAAASVPASVPKTGQQMELFDDRLLSKKARSRHKLIGQLFDTYWLVEYENQFYIIDQHAAHEKVLYERFMKEYQQKEIFSQFVSPPEIISLSLSESNLLNQHLETFQAFGFEIACFGGREYSIRAVPSNLYGISVQELFLEILDSLENETGRQTPDLISHRIATAACKAAVKGNQALSPLEANQLIDELLGLENPYHCPHGRPTIVSMTKYELEKKFKRIV